VVVNGKLVDLRVVTLARISQLVYLSRTITFPRIIPMPQVKLNSPDLFGVNVTTTGLFSGNARLIPCSGRTISVPQVPSAWRTNVTRAGISRSSLILSGLYPCSVTTTLAVWAWGFSLRIRDSSRVFASAATTGASAFRT